MAQLLLHVRFAFNRLPGLTFLWCGLLVGLLPCGHFSPSAAAQVPGYMGKRITLQGAFQFSPAFIGPTSQNRGSQAFYREDYKVGLNERLQGTVGYTLSRKLELNAGVAFGSTGVIAEDIYSVKVTGPGSATGVYNDVLFKMNTVYVDLGLRSYSFRAGSIAPYGVYMNYLAGVAFMNGEVTERRVEGQVVTEAEYGELTLDPRVTVPYLAIEYGNNQIFQDLILLNYGFRFCLPFVTNSYANLDDQIDFEAGRRFWLSNAFYVFIGTGIVF